ncbi:F0F1 ATP synthase subunit delta [Paraburkholderia caballeronis]|uniref:ATP synthase subunit delta n=1 Tax=Paraburkholderia caballeronis TaxID=416943 RepID=A0A1H7GYC7_9BURK|nr:F0F1 ATP synthase subunit delta [Paraburkholderia caballeronis]PXW29718.1 ATP synthase F1 subcomplex delta subunit [Paraburkholderia caballeronis]PXX04977.1 ATP synthase F1 subcomplex delta subunit [Paraburkholderia caballeronis]RAK06038.1 ATP synthase F1 subcomplex delta subunit [Paraburkholderia caballeronis]TDV11016.1 ATP synthase F1 subcomplex delta subunit [Paraburkholderia caballeronis]TDV14294.1 ATP synthase F1 subcomplex delta subunit [Paraburkholderia caballeronis]
MAELATIARPYAEALFGVAEAGDIAAWSTLVAELAQVAAVPEVLSVATSPKVAPEQVIDLLLSAAKSPLKDSPEAKNFVQMLVDNHRLQLLPQIHEQFEALRNANEGAADALIVSAFPIDGAQLNDLIASLERKFKCKLKPTVEVDPSLIGGVRVTVGDEVLDTSVRARLAGMQAALTA